MILQVPTATAMSAVFSNRSSRTLFASVPLLLYVRDKYVSVHRVKGTTSMAPTLQEGDVLLVRKWDSPWSSDYDSAVQQFESLHDVQHRPLLVPGQICIYQDPAAGFFDKDHCHIRRIIGVGGQYVTNNNSNRITSILPDHVYVEDDNPPNQRSSNHNNNMVRKKMVLGVAVAVVWPPSRWQRLQETPTQANGQPRARWY